MIDMICGEDDGSHSLAFASIAIAVAVMLISGCGNCGTSGGCGDGIDCTLVGAAK